MKYYNFIVVGGGIGGLNTATEILKHIKTSTTTTTTDHQPLLLLEATNKLGGRVSTFHKRNILYEEGAGRIGEHQILINKLVKHFKLEHLKHPLSSNASNIIIKQPNQPDYLPLQLKYPSIDDIIIELNHLVKKNKITEQHLINTNLLDLADELLTSANTKNPISNYMIDINPYYSELKHFNSKSALEIFTKEFNQTIKYYSLGGNGLIQIIHCLENEIKTHGGIIKLNSKCISIERHKELFKLQMENSKHTYYTSNLILALPKDALLNLSILSSIPRIRKLLNSVVVEPLYRIYAKYSHDTNGKVWFSGMSKTITNLPVKYIIPINEKTGIIMISYTDSIYAKYWLKLRMKGDAIFMKELNRQLSLIFPLIEIPPPLWISHYYWNAGAAYWKVGSHPEKVMNEIIQPLGTAVPLFICGENYSTHQAWMEGALETSNLVIEHLRNSNTFKSLKFENVEEILNNEIPKNNSKTMNMSKKRTMQSEYTYTMEEVAKHNKKTDAWIVIHNKVYDITKWIPMHPGGLIIMKGVGKDATSLFESVGHDNYARKKLSHYKIGVLKQ